MHDCDYVRDLERGVPINVDCSSRERVTAVSYQQSPHVGLFVSPKKVTNVVVADHCRGFPYRTKPCVCRARS